MEKEKDQEKKDVDVSKDQAPVTEGAPIEEKK